MLLKSSLKSGYKNFIYNNLHIKTIFFLKLKLLKYSKGFFGKTTKNRLFLRARKRTQLNKIFVSPFSRNISYSRLPLFLFFFKTISQLLIFFLFFKSINNVIFVCKTKYISQLILFSYSFNFTFLPFQEEYINIMRIYLFFLKINSYIINLKDYFQNKPTYSLSFFSKSKLLVFNKYNSYFIILLPSGIKKLFYYITTATIFNNQDFLIQKKFFKPNAGFSKKLGFRSIVRGVAKNPVDHPHGGRTKSIKLPKTPWGLVTKKK